jgi:hypothetical protein
MTLRAACREKHCKMRGFPLIVVLFTQTNKELEVHVACIGKVKNRIKHLICKSEEKDHLEYGDSIKKDPIQTWCMWTGFLWLRINICSLVNTVINI